VEDFGFQVYLPVDQLYFSATKNCCLTNFSLHSIVAYFCLWLCTDFMLVRETNFLPYGSEESHPTARILQEFFTVLPVTRNTSFRQILMQEKLQKNGGNPTTSDSCSVIDS
jgi:hypothetical protein